MPRFVCYCFWGELAVFESDFKSCNFIPAPQSVHEAPITEVLAFVCSVVTPEQIPVFAYVYNGFDCARRRELFEAARKRGFARVVLMNWDVCWLQSFLLAHPNLSFEQGEHLLFAIGDHSVQEWRYHSGKLIFAKRFPSDLEHMARTVTYYVQGFGLQRFFSIASPKIQDKVARLDHKCTISAWKGVLRSRESARAGAWRAAKCVGAVTGGVEVQSCNWLGFKVSFNHELLYDLSPKGMPFPFRWSSEPLELLGKNRDLAVVEIDGFKLELNVQGLGTGQLEVIVNENGLPFMQFLPFRDLTGTNIGK